MRNIICIGGSSGALDGIQRIVRQLPSDLPAAVFIVRHIAPQSSGLLAEILQPNSVLPIADAKDGEPIENGRIYVAPANQHLLLDRKTVRLANGPKENWVRPAIDVLFRTAAQYHGPRSIGIVLSGKLDDGTAGLWALKRRDGFAVVQDPLDAAAPEMPEHALAAVEVDAVTDADEIGTLLPEWCRRATTPMAPDLRPEKTIEVENSFLVPGPADTARLDEVGDSSGLVCPDCGGQLWRMKEGPLRYRCHVGHAQSARTFLAQQSEVVEAAEWRLIRALEEDQELCRQLLGASLSDTLREAVAARRDRDREKLAQLRPLLFADQGEAAFRGTLLHRKGNEPTFGDDSSDSSPVPRT